MKAKTIDRFVLTCQKFDAKMYAQASEQRKATVHALHADRRH